MAAFMLCHNVGQVVAIALVVVVLVALVIPPDNRVPVLVDIVVVVALVALVIPPDSQVPVLVDIVVVALVIPPDSRVPVLVDIVVVVTCRLSFLGGPLRRQGGIGGGGARGVQGTLDTSGEIELGD